MAQEFKLPELGENIETVDVTSVLVEAGDTVRKDQPVIEVETEKASLEVPAPFAGKIEQVLVKAGDKIPVGATILTIAPAGAQPEPAPAPELAAAPAAPEPAKAPASGPAPPAAKAPAAASAPAGVATPAAAAEREPAKVIEFARPQLGEPAPAAPSVRKLARELGVAIERVPGSGPGGRISIEDVKAFAKRLIASPAGAPAGPASAGAGPQLPDFARWGEIERQAWSNVRRATAGQMSAAWTRIPHVTQFDRADVTELEALRKQYRGRAEAAGAKLTVTAIVLKVAAAALRRFPKFNASIDAEREEVVLKRYVNLGVAVDTERGLLVPVIRDVDTKNIVEIAVELGRLSEKARQRKIAPDDLQGSCLTVTNLGGLGTTYFSPIVNWPEVAIVGVGRSETQAVWRNGAFEPRLILPLSVSYDHRWIDGADAARFLRWIAEALEQPLLLALEG